MPINSRRTKLIQGAWNLLFKSNTQNTHWEKIAITDRASETH